MADPLVEEALYAMLQAHQPLTALIGDRVWPVTLPFDFVTPAVVFHRISAEFIRSHDGSSKLDTPRFQVSAWAESFKMARQVANAIRGALDGRSGTFAGVKVSAVSKVFEFDRYEATTQLFNTLADYTVHHHAV